MRHFILNLFTIGLLLGGQIAFAQDATPAVTLKWGDSAPALEPSKWIKGEPVAKFEAGKIYVVEFWATWCGPCLQSIPHLTELQKKNPDVVFIGMDCLEPDQSKVAPFIEKMGDKMDYRVALDDAAGGVHKTWMAAAGQRGIPTAFIVDKDSKIAWVGHPMVMEPVLKQIVAGTFDIKKAAVEAAELEKARAAMGKLLQAGDIAAIDAYIKEHPAMAGPLSAAKYRMLMKKKDYPAVIALGKELAVSQKENAPLMNMIAWTMVDPNSPVENPDLELALQAATSANQASDGEAAPILDTLARVHFVRGDIDKAIEVQKKAVEKASNPKVDGNEEFKAAMAQKLAEYEAEKAAAK